MVGSSPDLITLKVEYVHDSDKRSHLMALLHAQRENGTGDEVVTVVYLSKALLWIMILHTLNNARFSSL